MKEMTGYNWNKDQYKYFQKLVSGILEDMNAQGLNLAEAELALIKIINDCIYDCEAMLG